ERVQAGTLDRGDMDEYVSAAALRLNESIALRRIEPFHGACSHHGLLCLHECNPGRTTIVRSPIRSQRCLWGRHTGEVRDKTRQTSNIEIVRGSRRELNRAK